MNENPIGQSRLEDVPQPGESSGKKPLIEGKNESIECRLISSESMSIDEILNSDSIDKASIPYYEDVYQDILAQEYDWGVTRKVKEYADYLYENPGSLEGLPSIQILDGKLHDGAHRIGAVYLLSRLHPNSQWVSVKLKVDFFKSNS